MLQQWAAETPPAARGQSAADAVFLSTHEPCCMCISSIVWAGFRKVYYLFPYLTTREQGIPHDLDIMHELWNVPSYQKRNKFCATACIIDQIQTRASWRRWWTKSQEFTMGFRASTTRRRAATPTTALPSSSPSDSPTGDEASGCPCYGQHCVRMPLLRARRVSSSVADGRARRQERREADKGGRELMCSSSRAMTVVVCGAGCQSHIRR